MRSPVPTCFANFAAVSTSLPSAHSAAADTLHLRDGRTAVGDGMLEGEHLVFSACFPTLEMLRLARSKLTPDSLVDVLDRRTDPKHVTNAEPGALS